MAAGSRRRAVPPTLWFAMRYRHPTAESHASGIWGGIGTRPAPDVWTPEVEEAASPEDGAPEPYRGLHVHRTVPRYQLPSEGSGVPVPVLLVIGFFVLVPAFFLLALIFG